MAFEVRSPYHIRDKSPGDGIDDGSRRLGKRTWFFQARPTARSTAPTLTWRAGCSVPRRRASRLARHGWETTQVNELFQ